MTSWVVSGCLQLLSGASDASPHPIRCVPSFLGLLLLVPGCRSCPQANWLQTFSWSFLFCIISCRSNFNQCRPLQHPKVDVDLPSEMSHYLSEWSTRCCGWNYKYQHPLSARHEPDEVLIAACRKSGAMCNTKKYLRISLEWARNPGIGVEEFQRALNVLNWCVYCFLPLLNITNLTLAPT